MRHGPGVSIIDLLMGGKGTARGGERELSEIDEEILHDVLQLIVRQAEGAWRLPEFSLVPNRRVKAHVLQQSFPPNEKVNVVRSRSMSQDLRGVSNWCFLRHSRAH